METNNKLRKALKDIGRLVEQIHFLYSDYPSEIHDIAREVNAALAEPVRNYEVGTAKEQKQRYDLYCLSRGCGNCPLFDEEGCNFAWAQKPYVEKEGESNGSN